MSPRERGVGDWEIMVDKGECPSILFCTHAESGDCGLKCTLSVKLPRNRDAGKQRHCRFAGVCFSGVNGFSPPATIPARSRSTASGGTLGSLPCSLVHYERCRYRGIEGSDVPPHWYGDYLVTPLFH